jgi:hypothetical protein
LTYSFSDQADQAFSNTSQRLSAAALNLSLSLSPLGFLYSKKCFKYLGHLGQLGQRGAKGRVGKGFSLTKVLTKVK